MHLLISVESLDEAVSIMATGVAIIDAKNTAEGALGAQFPSVTRDIVAAANRSGVRTSATLGDLPYKPGTAALAALGAASVGVKYVKAGLRGLNTHQQALEMMDAIRQAACMADENARVVASGYADWRSFGGLSPDNLVTAATDTQCHAVMLDTAVKNGRSLFEHMAVAELKSFVETAHAAGLCVGLAGSLRLDHADALLDLQPDIVGVRGAVCSDDTDRRSIISPRKTATFCRIFQALSTTSDARSPAPLQDHGPSVAQRY